MKLTLVTPEKKIESNIEVERLSAPTFRGEIEILPGHSPLMTTISTGVLRYQPEGEGETKKVVVSWGYLEVDPLGVKVLAETAEESESIDKTRAKEALERATKELESSDSDSETVEKYQRKLRRAQARLDLVENSSAYN